MVQKYYFTNDALQLIFGQQPRAQTDGGTTHTGRQVTKMFNHPNEKKKKLNLACYSFSFGFDLFRLKIRAAMPPCW